MRTVISRCGPSPPFSLHRAIQRAVLSDLLEGSGTVPFYSAVASQPILSLRAGILWVQGRRSVGRGGKGRAGLKEHLGR